MFYDKIIESAIINFLYGWGITVIINKIIRVNVFVFVLFYVIIAMSSIVNAINEQIFITVKVNGNYINMDSRPYIKDDRTFVSIRFIAEALGADVEWVDEEKKAIVTFCPEIPEEAVVDKTIVGLIGDKNKIVELYAGNNEIVINGEKKLIDTSVEITNDRTMVPLRFISENLDCSVEWDELTYSVLVNKPDAAISADCIGDMPYTDDDIIWLARIVTVEGRGLPLDGKLAIANVVLNRKKSSRFPSSIYDVIFAPGQFPPAHKVGFKESVPTRECVIAAKMALEGINNIEDCMFFNNAPFKSTNIKLFKRISGEYFYKYK